MRRTPSHTILAATVAALALAACAGAAQAADQVRNLPAFTSVDNRGPISISIDVGPAQSVKLSGGDDVIDLMRTEVVDGELRISFKDKHGTLNLKGDPKVTITMPQLNAFSMSGAGTVNLSHINGDRLDVTFGGAGALKADGHVRQLKMNVGGVGDIDTRALQADNVDVRVGGVGSVKLTATARLDASVGGVGSVTYYGHPKAVNTSGGGLGSISRGD